MKVGEIIAVNVRRLREERNWSQGQLAQQAGTSKVIISQIEKGDANPTINTIWKLAKAFSLPYTSLLEISETSAVHVRKCDASEISEDKYHIFSYYPENHERNFEIYLIEVEPHSEYTSIGHSKKSFEYVMLTQGELTVRVDGKEYELSGDDALRFEAAASHAYVNNGDKTAKAWMLIQYA